MSAARSRWSYSWEEELDDILTAGVELDAMREQLVRFIIDIEETADDDGYERGLDNVEDVPDPKELIAAAKTTVNELARSGRCVTCDTDFGFHTTACPAGVLFAAAEALR